jgi:heme/copper-type cytochrome/quinol oxidase subunit 2
MMRHPTIIIGVITASGENRERNPLPPTVKAVQVSTLIRIRRSPKVEPKQNKEKENTPFEITRKIPKNPTSIPIIFLAVIASPRKRRAAMVIKIGMMAMIHPVLMAVV